MNLFTDKAGNKFVFSCYKVVKKTRKFITLYGELNEATSTQECEQKRYVLITIRKKNAMVMYLPGPINYG
jgi:hypothetical protein